jgi:hypothetical protein
MVKQSLSDRLTFLISLFVSKIKVPFETYHGRVPITVAEFLWLIRPILHFKPDIMIPFSDGIVTTKIGRFHIHPDLQSLITVSPAFEKEDINLLSELIYEKLKRKEKVLFVDVGAHVGVYLVALGRKFRNYENFHMIAFEPNASNFYTDNFSFLRKNIKINKIKRIRLFKIGLGSRTTSKPNRFGITTQKLDEIIERKFFKKFDWVFIKMDIEGYETDALNGAINSINASKNVILLVEDIIDKKVTSFLESIGFELYRKLTPYNSFWEKREKE